MPRDAEERNRHAREAVDRAVVQFKLKLPITATCPDCEHPISVTYVEPPADSFVTKCECHRSNRILRSVMGPPDWILAERYMYLKKAAGTGVLDATFYKMYFTDCKFGAYFGCPLDPRALSPDVSEDVITDAIQRSKRLYNGQNAYVGAAFFKYPDEPLTYEEALKKLRRENPGFCEDAHDIVIHDNIRGVR